METLIQSINHGFLYTHKISLRENMPGACDDETMTGAMKWDKQFKTIECNSVTIPNYQNGMWPWYSSCSPVDGDSRSTVGTDAMNTPHREPTTWLDLGRGHDEYKRYLVLHEFGHVLGLGHEHQSPNARYFIDEKKAIDELTRQYRKPWRIHTEGKCWM